MGSGSFLSFLGLPSLFFLLTSRLERLPLRSGEPGFSSYRPGPTRVNVKKKGAALSFGLISDITEPCSVLSAIEMDIGSLFS